MAKKKVNKGQKIKDCLEQAKVAINAAEPGELESYLADVFARAKEYDPTQGFDAVRKAAKEINNEKLEALTTRVAITARNTSKYDANVGKLKKNVPLESMVVRSSKNADANIENAQHVAILELRQQVFQSFTRDEMKQLMSGKLDSDIYAVADGQKVADPLAQRMGEILGKYPEEIRNPAMVASDALAIEDIREDRFLQNTHDAQKLRNGGQSLLKQTLSKNRINTEAAPKRWAAKITEELNVEATAKQIGALNPDGTINQAKFDKFNATSFDNIVNNRGYIFTRSTVANSREALQRRKRQYYIFKDWQSWGRYHSEYGRGNLMQALMADTNASGNAIGLAQIFGDNPNGMYVDLKRQEATIKPESNLRVHKVDNLFRQVTGMNSTVVSPTLASVGASIRAYTSITRLGMIVINSINDVTAVGSIAQRMGYGFWQPYMDAILHAFGAFPEAERKLAAKQMLYANKVQSGYMGKFADATSMGDITGKVSNAFYHYNGMDGWTEGLKLSTVTHLMKRMGADSEKSMRNLHPQTQFQLNKFNISEHEWDGLRAKTKNRFFSLDNVDELSNSELTDMWQKSDKSVPLSDYRSSLNRKIYGLFDTMAATAALDPGAYEKFASTLGLPAGTKAGEATRAVMQFKTYPISYFRRAWYGGMTEMQGSQAKVMYALNMAAGNFMLGYLSVVMSNLALGKTTPDIKHMKFADIAMMVAPGLGVFSRILNPNNQDPAMVASLIMSPSVHLAADPFEAAVALATGNTKGAKKIAKDFVKYANPINTIPGIEPFWNQLLGNKPYLEPSQKQLFGA